MLALDALHRGDRAAERVVPSDRLEPAALDARERRLVGAIVRLAGNRKDEALAELTRGVPMRRVAEVDEVVEAILFAADPNNSFMTGHALSIDGGIGAI